MAEENATLIGRVEITPQLIILRIRPDDGVGDFTPGQYVLLGLPRSAPRIPEATEEETPPPAPDGKLIRRAYSISSGSLERDFLEFYVSLVTNGELTPRLFALKNGDRVFVGPKAKGLFTISAAPADANILMVATGTGLAPYISMLRTNVLENKRRKIAVLQGASYSWDLGYRGELEGLALTQANFAYVPVISRPAADPSWQGRTGRLPAWLANPDLVEACGFPLDAPRPHIFLCGNPGMIDEAERVLTAQGHVVNERGNSGNIHREKYW
jgi:ferredoxin--NADP+ reductase